MMKPRVLSGVSVYTRNQKAAKEFYVNKVGLMVRDWSPKWGYLELGTSKTGEDASINVWQPTRELWGDVYDDVKNQIGVVTCIGFSSGDIEWTVKGLKRKKVEVEWPSMGDENMATVTDPEKNSFFFFQSEKSKQKKAGLQKLEFVTVVTRDWKKAGEFWTRAVGMKRGMEFEENFWAYSLSPRGTSLCPFTPVKEMYSNVSDYEDDMKHIGEYTGIMFTTDDIFKLQKEMFERGVIFMKKAEKAAWGGMEAAFYDHDKNTYSLIQPAKVTPKRK